MPQPVPESRVAQNKADLRKRMREVRTQAASDHGPGAAEGLKQQILRYLEESGVLDGPLQGQVVAGYVSIHAELDPGPALEALEERGARLALPVTGEPGEPLIFRAWQSGDPLDLGRFGTFEPPDTASQIAPDMVLVPLLAFDGQGNRLGFGGGYYDRTLSALRATKNIVTYGVAFDAQEVEAVPTNALDERLDGVFTETRLVTAR